MYVSEGEDATEDGYYTRPPNAAVDKTNSKIVTNWHFRIHHSHILIAAASLSVFTTTPLNSLSIRPAYLHMAAVASRRVDIGHSASVLAIRFVLFMLYYFCAKSLNVHCS
jgi:hypothetical protein